jgi:hypothetical protein
MTVEETPPYRLGFQRDPEMCDEVLREIFNRFGLLPRRLELLFQLFVRRYSQRHNGSKTVKEWKRLWQEKVTIWDCKHALYFDRGI